MNEKQETHTMTFGILGSGSWGTAIAKILTDNGNNIHWWNRSEEAIKYIHTRHHNPQYLSTAHFDITKLKLTTDPAEVIKNSDCIVVAIPSAYTHMALKDLDRNIFAGKKIVSAIKGILPEHNLLLNEYLKQEFNIELNNYFAVLGPCHAEEVAAEKLSYLTFTGIDEKATHEIATCFKTDYLNTVENNDIYGVQYAAVLKNIYAVGSGIAHGLDYGDNFLSVLIANSADEMAGFLRELGVKNIQVGSIEHHHHTNHKPPTTNYAASVYLGDLLVTCYSLHSRNRAFGNMIGKGYSVKAAQMEMSMVAEGYNATRCMHIINQRIKADMPIAETVHKILWENLPAAEGFNMIEQTLV
ncbi:MAG TPA: NAD(P)H-dependent glycerol-3-phosphate dehydrogenase [Ferruginibacter sp.]|nr:NAD(P)H-dependent glycerol-3-phosphate dehydrogenase [Ferruginibacter sp.]